ncbi:MAG: anti-sigma factor [Blastochloris sp.]|nr:anti-sigma factor [Blastochloris sp.]
MLTEHQEEQASLYALDLLPESEVAAFQRDLLAKPELQQLVEDLRLCREVVVLESTTLRPPDHLKSSILQAIHESKAPLSKKTAQATTSKPSSLTLLRLAVPWSLAACLTLLAVWLQHEGQTRQIVLNRLNAENLAQRKTITELREKTETLNANIAQLESRNLVQAGTIAQLRATSPQAGPWTPSTVSVLWDKTRQEGLLVLSQMPAAEPGKIYQLWVIDPEAGGPISAGTFEVQADGSARILFRPSQRIRQAAQFAVSLEEGGAKEQPQGPVILAGAGL